MGSLPADFQRQFARKSHHYGLSWDRILGSDSDPFPLRKQPVPGVIRSSDWTARELAGRYLKEFALGGISVAVIASGLVYIGQLQDRLSELSNLQMQEQKQAQQIVGIQSRIVGKQAYTGIVKATISAGNRSTQVQVVISNLDKNANHFVLATPIVPTSGIQAVASLSAGVQSNQAILTLVISTPGVSAKSQEIAVQWIVV